MKKRTTRRALVMSLLSLLLCCSMLVGTTFAWFTDSVTSGKNKIIAGNLDIELDYSMNLTDWEDVSDAEDIFVTPNGVKKGLWEPGHTEIAYLRLTNAGTLNLKYQLRVNPFTEIVGKNEKGEDIKLSEILKFVATEPSETAPTAYTREAAQKAAAEATNPVKLTEYTTGVLPMEPGDVYYIALVVYMPEEVGNEANYRGTDIPTIEFALELLATQVEAEEDSFGDDYDAEAPVAVVVNTIDELKEAIANAADGDTIALGADITDADGLLITDKDITIDLNGKTFTVSEGATTNNRVFKITGNSNVTIKNGTLIAEGTMTAGAYGTIRAESGSVVTLDNVELYSYRGYGLNIKANTGSKVTVNNSYIYSQYGGGVEAAGGTVTLNNTTIKQEGVYSGAAWCSVPIGVNGGGNVTVNSGNYSASTIATDSNAAQGNWAAYVMSSGGNLIINGGTFTSTVAETAAAGNACGVICADTAAVVQINGGTFKSNGAILDMRNNTGAQPNPIATLAGGTFSSDPRVSGLYGSNLIKVAEGYIATQNADGSWKVAYDGAEVTNADELAAALASGEKILLKNDIEYQSSIVLAEGASLDGNGKTITYTGTEYTYHLVKLNTGATVENVTLENYRVRTESTTNGTVTLKNVTINMDNDETGLDISRGAGTAKLTNVTCKGTKDVAHLDPNTQVQVDYTPYGDVLLGTKWGLEATDCAFGSLHGWNTTNGSNVTLNNTTYTVFRMHYWSSRTLYIDGVETAWSESGAIPVAHDVGGCWSVQPAFK